ncbi:MAG: Lrp/AsnC family transcriptional regulator [Pseudomonadota bacterium]
MASSNTATVAVLKTPAQLNALEKCLLNEYQRGFPLCASPYAEIGRQLGVSETEVIDTLRSLQQRGLVSRVGPVFKPNRAGASTLAAMAVPAERLAAVARLVSAFDAVNHNYEREHHFNLWFVVTAPDEVHVREVLDDIEVRSGIAVLDLPLQHSFYIDLGFPLWC